MMMYQGMLLQIQRDSGGQGLKTNPTRSEYLVCTFGGIHISEALLKIDGQPIL